MLPGARCQLVRLTLAVVPLYGETMVSPGEWVLMVHQVPREPSTVRIAVWRRLRALGVARLADGVVALPADARTTELLEWVAGQVEDGGGSATLLRATPFTRREEQGLVRQLQRARAEEYDALVAEVHALEAQGLDTASRTRAVARLRKRYRAVTRRDHFPPPERERAFAALRRLADTSSCEVRAAASSRVATP